MAEFEYRVMARQKSKPVVVATFTESNWQWAEKLAAYLRDKGAVGVKVVYAKVKVKVKPND